MNCLWVIRGIFRLGLLDCVVLAVRLISLDFEAVEDVLVVEFLWILHLLMLMVS